MGWKVTLYYITSKYNAWQARLVIRRSTVLVIARVLIGLALHAWPNDLCCPYLYLVVCDLVTTELVSLYGASARTRWAGCIFRWVEVSG